MSGRVKMCTRRCQRLLIWASVWLVFILIYYSLHVKEHVRPLGDNSPKIISRDDQGRPLYPKMAGEQYFNPYIFDNGTVVVYSAFIDFRRGNMGEETAVRFVALVVTDDRIPLNCRFDLPNGRAVHEVNWYATPEPHGARYSAFVLSCIIPDDFDDPVSQLKQVELFQGPGFNGRGVVIPISNYIVDVVNATHRHQHTICVPTLFGERYSIRHLIEFVEAHTVLGIDHFVFYVFDRDLPYFKPFLEYYRDRGRLSYFPIALLVGTGKKMVWNYAQSMVAMDCVYRTAGFSRLVMLNDIDEYMVPYGADTWSELSSSVLWKEPTRAAYALRAFYFQPSLEKQNGYTSPLVTIKNVLATTKASNRLTKCIVRPERVFDQGIHHVSRVIQDFYLFDQLDVKVAAVHHLKKPPIFFFIEGWRNESRLRDLMMRDMALMKAYKNVMKDLGI